METCSSTEMRAFCLDRWPQLDDLTSFYFYLYPQGVNYIGVLKGELANGSGDGCV